MSVTKYPSPTAYNAPTSQVLTVEEGKELVRLCRTGRLYEVDAWIASGKSISVPSAFRKTPLQVAVEIGFHSLVRLLARNDRDVTNLNQALSDAVALRNLDTVSLLLEHGADPYALFRQPIFCCELRPLFPGGAQDPEYYEDDSDLQAMTYARRGIIEKTLESEYKRLGLLGVNQESSLSHDYIF